MPLFDYPRSALDRLVALGAGVLGVDQAAVVMQDEADPGWSVAVAEHGHGADYVGGRFPTAQMGVDEVLASGQPALAEGGCCVPVGWGGRVRGALVATHASSDHQVGQRELLALATLGRLSAAALEHADMGARLEPTMRVQIGSMGAAMQERIEASADVVDARDGYAPGRRRRLAKLARQVGERLGLPPGELDELELAARLHNAGKSKLPDAVLSKPAPLEDEERELVAFHPEWGAELLARVPGLEAVGAIVLFHRERVDGSGYPYGVRGARIPLASRIIGACDALDAMLSDRPYRMRLEPLVAESELRAGAASYFDAEVIEAVLTG